MKIGILGKVGSGKTALMVHLMLLDQKRGYTLWSNIHLKDTEYNHIHDTNFIEQVNNLIPNSVGVDEVGETHKGSCMFTFRQLWAQSRKSIGEKQRFYVTCQTKTQMSNDLRDMVDYFFKPYIITRDENGKPILIIVRVFRRTDDYPVRFIELNNMLRYNVYHTCDMYDTMEMVGALRDGKIKTYYEKYGYLLDEGRTKKAISGIIEEKEGLNISESKRITEKLFNYEVLGYEDNKEKE